MASVNIVCPSCGTTYLRTTKQINAVVRRSGAWECKTCTTVAKNISRTKPIGSTRINSKGYRMVKTEAGYVRQHVLVAEQKIGRKLLPGEVAHHLDHDKLNNAPENMVVWTHGEHSTHHNAHRAQIRNGAM